MLQFTPTYAMKWHCGIEEQILEHKGIPTIRILVVDAIKSAMVAITNFPASGFA